MKILVPDCGARRHNRSVRSGQAMIEFMFIIFMMIVMLFGLIDFGRVIYEKQILVNVSREGANLASRGTGNSQLQIMSNAASAVIISASPLSLTNKGCVIITELVNSNNIIKIAAQVKEGSLGANSKIGTVGQTANMPVTSSVIPPTNSTSFVSEVFYIFTPITSLGKLLNFTLPGTNYDVAYF